MVLKSSGSLRWDIAAPRASYGRIETAIKVAAERCYQLGAANLSVGDRFCDACCDDSLPSAGDFRLAVGPSPRINL